MGILRTETSVGRPANVANSRCTARLLSVFNTDESASRDKRRVDAKLMRGHEFCRKYLFEDQRQAGDEGRSRLVGCPGLHRPDPERSHHLVVLVLDDVAV